MHKHLKNGGKVLLGAGLGYSLFWLTSHPTSRVKKKLPERSYKKLSILPNITYSHKDNTYHMHHWAILSLFYLSLIASKRLRKSKLLHGLFWGSIAQGLFYKDRFQFKYPTLEVAEDVKESKVSNVMS